MVYFTIEIVRRNAILYKPSKAWGAVGNEYSGLSDGAGTVDNNFYEIPDSFAA